MPSSGNVYDMSVSPRLIRAFHLPAALSQLTPLCFDEGGRAGPASPRAIAASAFHVLSVRDM